MNQLTIGKFIALKRKEKNLTQEQLAETLGVSNKTVSKWECGKCMPDYGIVKPLCQELGITVSELMDGEVKADSSIRVFDEEQILDMLRRKCKQSDSHVNLRYPADCNGNRFACIFSVDRRNGFQGLSIRLNGWNICRRNACRSIYYRSFILKAIEYNACYAK